MIDKDWNNQIERVVKAIADEYKPEKIILFGSEAGAAALEEFGSKSVGIAI